MKLDSAKLSSLIRSPGHPGPSAAHLIPLQVTGKVPFCSEVPGPFWMPPLSGLAPVSPANPVTRPLKMLPAPPTLRHRAPSHTLLC